MSNSQPTKIQVIEQSGRRNLSALHISRLALRLKPAIAEKAKEQQMRKPASFVSQKSVEQKPIDTQKEIACAAGVSHALEVKKAPLCGSLPAFVGSVSFE